MARHGVVMATAMLGVAALAGLLALEAARAARNHQDVTERVLLDYAALGAEGVATRLQASLAGRLFPLLGAVGLTASPTRARLAAGQGTAAADLAASVAWAAQLGADGSLIPTPLDSAHLPPAALAAIVRGAAAKLPDGAYMGVVAVDDQFLVFAPPRAGANRTPAFGLPRDTVAALLNRMLARDPVLPTSLTRGEAVGDRISVSVLVDGRPLAQRGPADTSGFLSTYSLGPVFGGMTVQVALAESLAPILVIGGLPRSRLPFLAAVLALTVALAATALVQLGREMRLGRLREAFVAGASHELRTPLAQIRLFAETLRLDRVRDDAERERALLVVEREARRLEHLVENLLHFSRAERGTQRVAPEPVDLGTLTGEIVADFAPLAEKAGVRMRVEVAGASVAAVDPAAWRQVVLNLLDNAVKFGGPGTEVAVALRPDGDIHQLTVSDQGPGVPAADRHRIWERFYRGAQSHDAGIAGIGIGLATVRDLVTLHGGECRVESNLPRGARFVVRVPRLA